MDRVSVRNTYGKVLYHFFMALLGLVMLYPVIWMIMSSFKENKEVFTSAASIIPSVFRFDNYPEGLKGFGNVPFTVFFKNSFLISSIGTIGSVISSACIAYGFGRLKFKGSRILFALMMLTLMLPAQVLIVPQFIIFNSLNWVNTVLPLIVPHFFGQAFFIFLMIQFISGLPKELDESAIIDGCTRYGVFFRVILPLMTPALITSLIFSFYWKWEDFLGPLIYLNSPRNYTVSVALKLFADPEGLNKWGPMFAMATLSIIPVLVVFLCLQKYLVEGIATTGLKA